MKLEWDKSGEHFYETGVDHCALYLQSSDGTYPKGVVWNGITSVSESPSGAEATSLYADNIKYLSMTSVEEFGATLEAYTYPDEFAECDGSASPKAGVIIGQQDRKTFGLVYRTRIGNDIDNDKHGYKIHIIYGAKATPSEKSYTTVNDSPEAITMSWTLSTTPVNVTGHKPTASLIIDSTKISKEDLQTIENKLFGSDTEEATLPLPDEIIGMVTGSTEEVG